MSSQELPINPTAITDFKRDQYLLELFWIFSICVAGKTASTMATKIQSLAANMPRTPLVTYFGTCTVPVIERQLRRVGMGQYDRISNAIKESANIPCLRKCSAEDLEVIKGVGFKTSRFFILHSRKDADVLPIDRHIYAWLRRLDVAELPETIPKSRDAWLRVERLAKLAFKAHYAGIPYAYVDQTLWALEGGYWTDKEAAQFLKDKHV